MNTLSSRISDLLFRKLPQASSRLTSTYKTALSLETLYPKSNLKLTTPPPPVASGNEAFSGYIPMDQLEVSYSRSTGPGGQNVNKVNTKVDVRFHLETAKWLNEEVKAKLHEKLKPKLTKEGYAVFRSDLTRSQHLNLADCLQKLRHSIRECLVEKPVPTEESLEQKRRKMERSIRERLAVKRQRSQIKTDRQSPNVEL